MSWFRRGRKSYECTCGCPLSMHELTEGGSYGKCHGLVKISGTSSSSSKWVDCRCLHYVGERPPEDYLRLATGN